MTINGKVIDPRITDMVERIVKTAQPDQVILFGSRAVGTPRSDSDVDLLVVMPLRKPRRRLEGDLHAAVAESELSKDIVVITPEELERFRDVPGTIVKPALESGLVVYRRAA
jgi:predicted nucleotidyltransferase